MLTYKGSEYNLWMVQLADALILITIRKVT